jgi:ubiquinone/menaquinone biosynthesis C-methylase UbiE
MQEQFDLSFPLVEASAEDVPLPDESFDLAVSEYGASIWCNPERWIPEAYRLLRPGGRLWFLRNSTISILCAPEDDSPVTTSLQRAQRGLGRLEWEGGEGVEWQPPHGELFRLLRRTGFDVVDLVELYAPDDAEDHPYYTFVPAAWARSWPIEEIWVAEKPR